MHDSDTLIAAMDEGLTALREADRQLIIDRFFKSRPVGEIAALLGVSDNTASKRIERALARLRAWFAQRGIEVSGGALGVCCVTHGIQSAPPALSGQIAKHAAVGSSTIACGVLLMTASTKVKAAVVALVFFLALGGGYAAVQWNELAETPSTMPRKAQLAADSASNIDALVTLTGTVRDSEGTPVAGALVSQGYSNSHEEYRSTRTGADGRFSLAGVRAGRELMLAVQVPGFAPELLREGLVSREPTPFALVLKPGRTIRFRLLDARGAPIANLPVAMSFWRDTQVLAIHTFKGGKWTGLMTDADGRVTIENAPDDEITFDPITPDTLLRARFKLAPSDDMQTIKVGDPIEVRLTVIDAETKAPIQSFSVIRGRGDDASSPDYWANDRPEAGENGAYETKITWSYPYHFFRVEAPGYAPTVKICDEKNGVADLQFLLQKAAESIVAIQSPDALPAVSAEVFVVRPKESFSLQQSELLRNPKYRFGDNQASLGTDAAGKASLPSPIEPAARVVIIHPSGFANVSWTEIAETRTIKLSAWARVSGIAKIGSAPAAQRTVTINYLPGRDASPYISGTFETQTDMAGRYTFYRVPPGQSHIGLFVISNAGSQLATGTIGNPSVVTFASGQIAEITIGGTGRAIVGQVTGVSGEAPKGMVYGLGTLRDGTPVRKPEAPPKLQERLDVIGKLSDKEAVQAFEKLRAEPEWTAFEAANRQAMERRRNYAFAVAPDGGIRIDDVKAGTYKLSIEVFDEKNLQPVGIVQTNVTIPPEDNKEFSAIDLGPLPIKPKNRVKSGGRP